MFGRDQFALLAATLADIKGRFILSINDVPPIREIFGRFEIEEVRLQFTISGGNGRPAKELVISGVGACD